MRPYKVFLLIIFILILDQALKIWIKTHMIMGEEIVITNWFRLHFTENPGMAFGMVLPGITGKLFLSVFRLAAAAGGTWYVVCLVKQKAHWGFITACSLILAGAIGNMIDGAFYGLFFTDSFMHIANVFPPHGYAGFLQGHVVDMLWFPVAQGVFPQWVPHWGGQYYEFFRPVFNIADSSITIGVLLILIFQRSFFKAEESALENEQEKQASEYQPLLTQQEK